VSSVDWRWLPIETAPRGDYFLGFCPDLIRDNPKAGMCVCWYEEELGWWIGEQGLRMHPTHWMPLPNKVPKGYRKQLPVALA